MPPKRKKVNLDGSDAEGPHPTVLVNEDESTAPKKRGRKSLIDTILQEEARGAPAPVLPQNQWSVSLAQPQNLLPTTNPSKRRKVQSVAPPLAQHHYPSPGTPSVWGTNKGDFFSAFKSLTESFGGICFTNLGTLPVLAWFIEGPRWPEDVLNAESLHLSLVTEFKPKDQSTASTSVASLEKKKGGRGRRTKRGDLSTPPIAPRNVANGIGAHTGTVPLSEGPQSVPENRWPCFVPSPIFNPDYPTFCECLQPHCSYHCPTARGILSRGCTTYSWPAYGIASYSNQSLPAEIYTNHDTSVEVRRQVDLIEGPGPFTERKPRVQTQVDDSLASTLASCSRLPLNAVKMYAQVVPELASLLDHMERKSPLLVISTTDASMDSFLPFRLSSEYGCAVLGFFDVESVECESENPSPTSSIQPGKLSWRVRLRYTTPSDATKSNGNSAPPWWLDMPTTSEKEMPDVVVSAPSAPVLEPEKNAVDAEAGELAEAPALVDARWCIVQALEGNPKRSWWHCLGCGKINHRDMLIHRRCSFCKRNEDPVPPFIIEEVLQDTSTAPYPTNHNPQSMKPDDILVKEFPDMTNVYCYSFRDEPLSVETAVETDSEKGACVKHIFTGPYQDLKVQATSLFLQIQEGIELSRRSSTTGVAEGPYYSWLSPRHGWNDSEIPQCIHQARKHISKFVGGYCDKDPGDENNIDGALCEELSAGPRPSTSSHGTKEEGEKATENIRINHVVALAWTASGSRRGAFVSAKDSPVFVLCLGANVELELERCPPDPPESSATANPESSRPAKTSASPKGKRKGADKGKAAALQPPKEKPKPKPKSTAPPHERLKISMVHGDVLVLSGGDYIYALTRTGMSILLFALPDAQY